MDDKVLIDKDKGRKQLDFGKGSMGKNRNLNLEIISKNVDVNNNKDEKLLDSKTNLNDDSQPKSNSYFFNKVLVLVLIHKVIESLGSMSIKY